MQTKLFLLAGLTAALFSQTPQDDKRLIFSTYLGGDRADEASGVATDQNGNTYVVGETSSTDFNGKGLGSISLGAAVNKAFLTKYSPDGKEILWSYQIGGASSTKANAITVDAEGNVYVAGTTGARDLPLMKPVQDKQPGLNIAFLMKFSADGKLLFSTYLGGERNEEGLALAVDSQQNIYLAGRASSNTFPVKNALQPQMAGGGQDAFVAKFTADYQLAWSTYLGGTSGTDNIYAIAVGPDDALFVTGESMSPGLATENAFLRQPPSYSSFVAKLSPAGNAIQWFTYLGHRSGYTKAQAIAVDRDGRAWIGGTTSAKEWPMSENAIQPKYAGGFRDGFLVRISADGSATEYATYLGGSANGQADPDDTVQALKVDWRGHVYVTGETSSADFPTNRQVQPYAAGAGESFLLRLDPEKQKVLFSTFWGGSKKDTSAALMLGPGENMTFAGVTASDNLPVRNPVRKQMASSTDAFVTRICDPWLSPYPVDSLAFGFVTGQPEAPAAQEIQVATGCVPAHDIAEVQADQPWLRVDYEGRTAPFKMRVSVNPAELPAGEYKATIKVVVPAAVYPELSIPVTFTVANPPASE